MVSRLLFSFLIIFPLFIGFESLDSKLYKLCKNEERICLGVPTGCETSKNCELLALLYPDTLLEVLTIDMHLNSIEKDRYMAFGIGTLPEMGGSSVGSCINNGDDQKAVDSYNEHRDNVPLGNFNATFNIDRSNGVFSCSYQRNFTYSVNMGGTEVDFDLLNKLYYLLVAHGTVHTSGRLGHHKGKAYTKSPQNLTVVSPPNLDIESLIKLHGSMMVIAWTGFVSIGIMVARHYKSSWNNKEFMGVKIWFVIHRAVMMSSILFAIIGVTSIFVQKGGISDTPHAIIGIVTNCLMLAQPIMAVFRCSPDSSKRPVFNWVHFIVGNSAHILAILAILLVPQGTLQSGPETYLRSIVGTYILIHILVHLIMQFHSLSIRKKSNDGSKPDLQRGENFKQFMLGFYLVIITLLTTILVVILCVNW